MPKLKNRTRSSFAVAVLALLLAAPVSLLVAAGEGRAGTTTSAILPTARYWTSAVWDGTNAYIFGGSDSNNDPLNQIVRYNPTTNAVTTMSTILPTARTITSAVWDGTNAYIFGGFGGSGSLNEIVRYNPATNTVTTMSTTLPSVRHGTSAVWDGTNAYIFGGYDGGVLNQIVRYNPATNTVTTMSATLPTARFGTSAVWDGTNAYIFGGWGGAYLSQIVRYNPATNTVTTVSALPTTSHLASAAWDGTNAYIFGGANDNDRLNQIVRYNPTTNTVTTMSATLPTARHGTSAVWDGTNAYIFGGYDGDAINQIVQYNPATPSAPTNLEAASDPGAGQITLNWQAPIDTGSSPITNYRIYRGTSSGTETFLDEVGNVLTYTDNTCGPAGTICYYTVRAVNAAGESADSNEAHMLATGPPPPCDGGTVGITPPACVTGPDGDGDGVPDAIEPLLCENQNPHFHFDGDCNGGDWSLPTLEGLIEDLQKLLEG